MAKRTQKPLDEVAAKMVKYHDEDEGKKLGYFESLNARGDLRPAEGYRVAKADEELLPTPVYELYLIVKGEAVVTVNGQELKPRAKYADGIREYMTRSKIQTPAGQKPGLRSLKISEGAEFKIKTFSISTGGNIW